MPNLQSRRHVLKKLITLAAVGGTTGGSALAGTGSAGARRLKLERVEITVPHLPPALDGFRIAQLSDLHLEPFTTEQDIQRAVDLCNGLKPDLVALTGDFVTDTAEPAPVIAEILGELKARHGVYACLGNHDYWSDAERVVMSLKERKIRVLCEETRHIRTEGGSLYLGATDSNYNAKPNVRKTLAEFREKQPLVIMMHEPDGVDVLAAAGIQGLQISGHTHGGQLRFLGKEPMNMRRARWGKKYLEGHYDLGAMQLYVNRGIGCVGVPWRIGCPPEVTELTLRSPQAA